jgi:thiol-disulfide isomerase/thioredoxin
MKKFTSLKLAALLLLWLGSTQAKAQGMEFAHGTVAEVLQLAKSTNKLVFVDCFTDWCGPCKWMAANTFTNGDVGKFFNENFVNFKLDMEKGEGVAFAKKYSVNAYPTLLFLDGDGNLAHANIGALPPDQFLKVAQTALDPDKRLGGLITEYNNGNRSIEFLTNYILRMGDGGLPVNEALEIWAEKIKPEAMLTQKDYFMVFADHFRRIDTDHFKYFLANRAQFEKAYGKDAVDNKISQNYMAAIQGALRSEDEKAMQALKEEFKKVGGQKAEGEILQLDYMMAIREDNTAQTIKIATELAEKYNWDNWSTLNTLAWDFYETIEDKKALQSAAKWAKRSIELTEHYYNLDTYGMLQKKLGNNKEAIQYLEKAIAAAKESGDDYSATQEALDELK